MNSRKGDYGKASKLQKRLTYLNEVLVKRHNQPSAIKEALKVQGLSAGYPRRLALPLEDGEKEDIEKVTKTVLEQNPTENPVYV